MRLAATGGLDQRPLEKFVCATTPLRQVDLERTGAAATGVPLYNASSIAPAAGYADESNVSLKLRHCELLRCSLLSEIEPSSVTAPQLSQVTQLNPQGTGGRPGFNEVGQMISIMLLGTG